MNSRELYDNEYLRIRLDKAWPLLFMFAFPDIDVKLITDIDYSLHDFMYYFLIYAKLKPSYLRVKTDINMSHLEYRFMLHHINNMKIRVFILNKNQLLMDKYINGIYGHSDDLYLYINQFKTTYEIKTYGVVPIKLSKQEALNFAVYLSYFNI